MSRAAIFGAVALAFVVTSRAVAQTDAPPPKVIVVVAGDPDDALRSAASEVERGLDASGAVTLPSDEGLRAAFRGEPGTEDDGLEPARAERRRLGAATSAEHPVLRRIARVAGAVAVVVVRTVDGEPVVEVFDVGADAFYDGRAPLAENADATRFVVTRARRARARTEEPAPEPDLRAPREAVQAEPTPADPPEVPPARAFFRKHWAYFVVGALLVAVVTAAVVTTRRDTGNGDPVLRFRPGGD
jgi:hypothetical protein